MTKAKIIIIGAGAAGIAAATKLLENGFFNIKVLEASNRIGGRILTEKFGNGFVELGAQWCHGEKGNVVYDLVNQYDLLAPSEYNFSYSLFVRSSGALLPYELCLQLQDIYQQIVDDKERLKEYKGSLGNFILEKLKHNKVFNQIDPKIRQLFLEWVEKMENSLEASDTWFEVSAKGYTEYWTCPGNQLLNWKERGTKTVLDVLMKRVPDIKNKLPIESKILFNKEVYNIVWNKKSENCNSNIYISCSDGSHYEADHVIVTVSLGVLKECVNVLFTPSLPEFKIKAIEGLNIGSVNKIFLKFPFQWWPEDSQGFSFLWEEDDKNRLCHLFGGLSKENKWVLDLFGFYPVDNAPNVLLGWIVQESARKMELLSDVEVTEICTKLLRIFVGKMYHIPDPVGMIRSKWFSNPYFRGSYSYRSTKTDKMCTSSKELAKPLKNYSGIEVVMFAGEATHDHYYSTVHGAVGSGWREAERMIKLYNNATVTKTRLVIIGAGLAGLAAAKVVNESGVKDFIVLEAQNQPGGRIRTVSFGESFVDTGAQWLHGNKNSLWKFCQEHNLLSETISQEGKGIYIREDGYIFDEFLVNVIDFKVGQILEECENFFKEEINVPISVGEYLIKRFEDYLSTCTNDSSQVIEMKRELLDWHVRFQVIDNSCNNLYSLSAKNWGSYFCSADNGQAHINFKNGYGSLIDTLCNLLPSTNILYNKSVVNIQWKTNDYVNVICDDGSIYQTDFVLVTVSLGVLKKVYEKMFTPQLPLHFKQTINSMGFAGITKIFLEFDRKWWNVEGFQLIWKRETITEKVDDWTKYISGFDEVLNQKNVLLGWIGGKGAEIVENIDEYTIGRDCIDLFKRFTGRSDIPMPVRVLRTKWITNPYICGGYSHTTSTCDIYGLEACNLNELLLGIHSKPVMAFAGEAWHPSYYSTTHGAFESGETQAKRALESLSISLDSSNILNKDKNVQKISSRL